MARPVRMQILLATFLIAAFVAAAVYIAHYRSQQSVIARNDSRIPFAVLGDSDSHSYHDRVLLNEAHHRGAEYRKNTYQWTEVIAGLRSDQIDMGAWGTWGLPGTLAQFAGKIGLEDRAPRKQDYRFNFAVSGAKCSNLTQGMSRQTQRLIYLMDRNPARWERGIVTIRIGINNLGIKEALDRFAKTGLSPEAAAEVAECTDYIRAAVALIRAHHPHTKIVLVGILSNADWVPMLKNWQSAAELASISAVMDAFDAVLQELAKLDSNIYFWNDREWLARTWGARDGNGRPNYHSVTLKGATITYSQGDAPTNATLGDGHNGSVWNALWARDLLATLNSQFGYDFRSITDAEIAHLIDPEQTLKLFHTDSN